MTICTVCGAYSRRSCELEDEFGMCPFEEMGGWDEPDPDQLREDRDERARVDRMFLEG
jgi:hypothetical protein